MSCYLLSRYRVSQYRTSVRQALSALFSAANKDRNVSFRNFNFLELNNFSKANFSPTYAKISLAKFGTFFDVFKVYQPIIQTLSNRSEEIFLPKSVKLKHNRVLKMTQAKFRPISKIKFDK